MPNIKLVPVFSLFKNFATKSFCLFNPNNTREKVNIVSQVECPILWVSLQGRDREGIRLQE